MAGAGIECGRTTEMAGCIPIAAEPALDGTQGNQQLHAVRLRGERTAELLEHPRIIAFYPAVIVGQRAPGLRQIWLQAHRGVDGGLSHCRMFGGGAEPPPVQQ